MTVSPLAMPARRPAAPAAPAARKPRVYSTSTEGAAARREAWAKHDEALRAAHESGRACVVHSLSRGWMECDGCGRLYFDADD